MPWKLATAGSSHSVVLLGVVVLGWVPSAAAQVPGPPDPAKIRYDLLRGDHLTYKQVLVRDYDGRITYGLAQPLPRPGGSVEYTARAEWTSHVLVLDRVDDEAVVAIQRNRTNLELQSWKIDGQETQAQRAEWLSARAGTERYGEANRFGAKGMPALPVQVIREWPGKAIWVVNEILPLPPTPAWVGSEAFHMRLRAGSWEAVGPDQCLRVEWVGSGDPLVPGIEARGGDPFRLRYWFCPESGLVRKVDFEATYPGTVFERIHEHLTIELVGRARGERPEDWRQAPDLREAIAAAGRLVSPSGVAAVPAESAAGAQARGLACAADSGWIAAAVAARAPRPQQTGTTFRIMRTRGFEEWPYIVRVPDDYRGDRPYPLLIYLAGNAGPAIEGALIAQQAVAPTDYVVLYPNAAGWWWWARQTDMVDHLLTEVLQDFNIDPNRIYLSGLSNGGTGTFYYATLFPQRFTAAVMAMGAGFHLKGEEGQVPALARNTANLPMLFLHGAKDETIPVKAMTETAAQMKPRWAAFETKVFPERGHEIALGRGDDGMTLAFFQDYVRRPLPRRLDFQLASLRYPRQYWIEVVEKAPGASAIVVETRGSIGDDNSIRLETTGIRRLRLLLRPDLLPGTGPVTVTLNGKKVFVGEITWDCALLARTLTDSGDPFLAYSAVLDLEVPAR